VVLDVDPRNGGDETLEDLRAKHGALPETPGSLTGGGGAHHLFAYPADVSKVKSGAIGRGLDCKADGGYIVAPPSLHASGRSYHWEALSMPEDVALAPLPDYLAALVVERAPAVEIGPSGSASLSLLGQAFIAAGLWIRSEPSGDRARVKCPWESEHTSGAAGDGSTVIFGPKPGSGMGWFHCSHSHCTGRSLADVHAALGADTLDRAHIACVAQGLNAAGANVDPSADWMARLIRETKGGKNSKRSRVTASQANANTILGNDPRWTGVLAYDELGSAIRKLVPPPWGPDEQPSTEAELRGEWEEIDTARAIAWCTREWGVSFSREQIGLAVRHVAGRASFHPVRAYFESLAWDGVPRIDAWLATYLAADGPAEYLARVGAWWLISAVARTYSPGCQVDSMLILQGGQGIGKSTAARILGGAWFSDTRLDLASKDAFLSLRGRLIVELAELADVNRVESDRVKAFASSPADWFRPPYAAQNVSFPRRCVFIGTTNAEVYLRDETGGRRFWPVRAVSLAADELRRDRDQLWAEAVARYRAGARWYPTTREEVAACKVEQDDRAIVDEWDTKIALWIRRENRTETTVGEVLSSVIGLSIEKWTKADQTRVGIALTRMGWRQARTVVSGARVRMYSAPAEAANEAA
jgi:predicted P-loop ATPase